MEYLKLADLATEDDLYIEEIDGTVRARKLTVNEVSAIQQKFARNANRPEKSKQSDFEISGEILASLVNPKLTIADMDTIGFESFNAIIKELMEFNGLSEKKGEEVPESKEPFLEGDVVPEDSDG